MSSAIQFYAMADRWRPMLPCHPDSYDAQWCRREDLERLEKELTELRRFKAAALTLTTEQSILHVMEKQAA